MESVQETNRIFLIIIQGIQDGDRIVEYFYGFTKYCLDRNYFRTAHDYLEKILLLMDPPGDENHIP